MRITFDPRKISYGRILQIYFSVAHDPTELNRQGPDAGSQYRSAIFPANAEQARVAQAYIGQLSKARAFDGAIVTKIEPNKAFYPAEAYHQDFSRAAPELPLHRRQRHAEDRRAEAPFSGNLPAGPRAYVRAHELTRRAGRGGLRCDRMITASGRNHEDRPALPVQAT